MTSYSYTLNVLNYRHEPVSTIYNLQIFNVDKKFQTLKTQQNVNLLVRNTLVPHGGICTLQHSCRTDPNPLPCPTRRRNMS